jgi:tRNA1(Val) A37 N6-methylase TrmN6
METSLDTLLDGQVHLEQPRQGHRAGLDGVLLAALAPVQSGDCVVDVGAGVGTVGLCAAFRTPLSRLVFLERDPLLANLAERNAIHNAFMEPVTWSVHVFDVTAPARERAGSGVSSSSFDHVLMNPPFDQPHHVRPSPDARKRAAYLLEEDGCLPWIKCARWLLKPHGRVSLIFRAQALPDMLAALAGRFGSLDVTPIHTRPDAPANRLFVTAQAGSRGPLRFLPPHVVGTATSEA